MTHQTDVIPQDGDVIEVPLNKLKKSPRNARRTPHAEADIEALAASIAAKGVLQAPVVEPETDAEGAPTGCYLVSIGEGRRLALLLRAKRKQIKKSEPVRCVVDLNNDPHEISLDENVSGKIDMPLGSPGTNSCDAVKGRSMCLIRCQRSGAAHGAGPRRRPLTRPRLSSTE